LTSALCCAHGSEVISVVSLHRVNSKKDWEKKRSVYAFPVCQTNLNFLMKKASAGNTCRSYRSHVVMHLGRAGEKRGKGVTQTGMASPFL